MRCLLQLVLFFYCCFTVGDLVYSYDTLTGEVSQKEVTDTFVRTSNHLNYLTIIDENGNEQTIETTDSHPFWVVTDNPDLSRAAREVVDENGAILYHENLESGQNGFWVEAKDLQVGDVFLSADGKLSALTNIVRVEQSGGIDVFNFTVDGNHNYFILEKDYEYGQSCVLVHNAWYHGTDIDSANDIVTNGLSVEKIKDDKARLQKIAQGLFVHENSATAKSYALLRGQYFGKDSAIIEFSDEIEELLAGHSRNNEAFIPFDNFDEVNSNLSKFIKEITKIYE